MHFCSHPPSSHLLVESGQGSRITLHQHFAEPAMSADGLMRSLSAFDIFPNLCSYLRLLEVLRQQLPRLTIPSHWPAAADSRMQSISRSLALSADSADDDVILLSFLDFIQVHHALFASHSVRGFDGPFGLGLGRHLPGLACGRPRAAVCSIAAHHAEVRDCSLLVACHRSHKSSSSAQRGGRSLRKLSANHA